MKKWRHEFKGIQNPNQFESANRNAHSAPTPDFQSKAMAAWPRPLSSPPYYLFMQLSKHFQLREKNPPDALIYPKVKYSEQNLNELKLQLHRTNEELIFRPYKDQALLAAIIVPFSVINSVSYRQEGFFQKSKICILNTQLTTITLTMEDAQQLCKFIACRLQKFHKSHISISTSNFRTMLDKQYDELDKKKDLAESSFKSYQTFKANLENIKNSIQNLSANKTESDKELQSIFAKISVNSKFQDYTSQELKQVVAQAATQFSEKNRGTVSLIDIYFCVNKVKKAGFVSPSQIQKVCRGLPMFKLITLQDGHKILYDKKLIQCSLDQLFKDQRGYSLEQLSQSCRLNLLAVGAKLKEWESQGLVCRDDRISGVKFFKNIYL